MGVYATNGLTFKVGPATGENPVASAIVKDIDSIDVKLKGENKTWNPLDQKGWQRSLITGKSLTISHKGKRNEGDAGNDMVAALADKIGDDCKLAYELDFPSGAKISGIVAVDISTFGGSNSTDVSELDWDAVFDGKPTFTAAGSSSPLTLVSSVPAANATGVSDSDDPVLTFSNPLNDYAGISLVKTSDGSLVTFTASLDGTGEVLTLTPSSAFAAATSYEIILAGISDEYGHTLATQVIKFTTA